MILPNLISYQESVRVDFSLITISFITVKYSIRNTKTSLKFYCHFSNPCAQALPLVQCETPLLFAKCIYLIKMFAHFKSPKCTGGIMVLLGKLWKDIRISNGIEDAATVKVITIEPLEVVNIYTYIYTCV